MSKKIKVLIVVAALIAVFAVGAYFVRTYFFREAVYTGYTTLQSTDRADSRTASYVEYGDGFLRYFFKFLIWQKKCCNRMRFDII